MLSREEIVEKYLTGTQSMQQIGEELGVSRQRIHQIIRGTNYLSRKYPRRNPLPEIDWELVQELRQQGKFWKDIAGVFQIPYQTFLRCIEDPKSYPRMKSSL